MPPFSRRLHCLLERFIFLKFFSYIFGKPTQGDGLNLGFTSAVNGSHTLNVLEEPHFSVRPTPPLTSSINDHLQPPQTRSPKKKALLIGVEYNNEQPTSMKQGLRPQALKSPHKDILDMRQFLIGKFKFSSKTYYLERLSTILQLADHWHYDPDDIVLLMNKDDLETIQPTKKNIVCFVF